MPFVPNSFLFILGAPLPNLGLGSLQLRSEHAGHRPSNHDGNVVAVGRLVGMFPPIVRRWPRARDDLLRRRSPQGPTDRPLSYCEDSVQRDFLKPTQ